MSTQLTDADLARLEDLKAGAPYTNATKEAVTALVAEVRRLRAERAQLCAAEDDLK